jgi:hypothetical protein
MGDDNEITDLVRRESATFLDEARKATKAGGRVYNLDEEFVKTKRNRSFFVAGVTIATIVVLSIVALTVTEIIRRKTANTPVDVKPFAELNLKDILDTAKRNESELEQAKLELSGVQGKIGSGIDSIDKDYQGSVAAIKARGLSKAEESRRLATALAEAERKKRAVRAQYADELEGKRAKLAEIQERVDSYDKRLSDQSRAQQDMLDSQSRLFGIEKERLVASYEGKIADLEAARRRDAEAMKRQREEITASLTERFNPIFEDDWSRSLLEGWKEPPFYEVPSPFHPALLSDSVLDEKTMSDLESSYKDYLHLSTELRGVSYVNSVPGTLSRMESELRSATLAYRAALAKAGGALEERDARIAGLEARAKKAESALEQYRWATSQYVLDNRDGGYIIDSRDPEKILVAINPAIPVSAESQGFIVRSGDKAIATIRFYLEGAQLRARVVSIQPGETIKPFDAVVVQATAR